MFTVLTRRNSMVVILVVAILGAVLVLVSTWRYGAGLNADAVLYISAARSLTEGRGYLTFTNDPLVVFPPLFPTVLALFELTGMDVVSSARYLMALVFCSIIIVSGMWLLNESRSRIFPIVGSICILLSWPLLHVSSWVWSEPLFVLLLILFLRKMERYLSSPRLGSLAVAAALGALACLQRYMGVTLILTGLVLLFANRRTSIRERITAGVVFAGISSLPGILWAARNWLLTGTLQGDQTAAATASLLENVSMAGETFALWFLPWRIALAIPGYQWFFLFLILLVSLLWFVTSCHRKRGDSSTRPRVLVLGVFVTVYVTTTLAIGTVFFLYEHNSSRYLSPVYVPLVLLVFFSLDEVFAEKAEVSDGGKRCAKMKRLFPAVASVMALWIGFASVRACELANKRAQYGVGSYTSKRWQESQTAAYIRNYQSDAPLFSNAPDAIYLFTGKHATFSPWKARFRKKVKPDQYKLDGGFLVWFKSCREDESYNPEELKRFWDLDAVEILSDGAIYSIHTPTSNAGNENKQARIHLSDSYQGASY